ncbi:hypothetical protein CspeluHIS016_0112340 [Cutaneotrichosporon spelunceum]|uniref:Phosducin thioredoxin-like domain-containing protein n=1 Tax=Cutaneotrichosporon spelunceum TaxID=1672016 RepID=A0AAD3TQ52_9TREE|nr:hypothetical protein CspeluHIS016_0112340 [Cutaneotrichosporon spelunceum]
MESLQSKTDELSLTDNDDDASGDTRNLRQGTVRSLSPAPRSRPSRGPPDLERVEHTGRQTGPKGVRDDARAAAAAARARTSAAIKATRAEQERRALVGAPWREDANLEEALAPQLAELDDEGEEEGDDDDEEDLAALRWKRLAALRRDVVREVDGDGYLAAVERSGWVLVAIYEPDMDRCDALLAALPAAGVPAVRARATRIGFSLLSPDTRVDYDYDSDGDDDDGVRADPDVLPTLLVYRDGELRHNWVRVDLEPMYAAGLGALLESEGICGRGVQEESE